MFKIFNLFKKYLKSRRRSADLPLISCLCTQEMLLSDTFQNLAEKLGERRGHLHRKVWEWCFIVQALKERGFLQDGKYGLGFAVGQEPLSALFASHGAKVLATDLFTEQAQANGWVETGQHASGYEAINLRRLCDPSRLKELVEFQFADMNSIGPELFGRFDFVWSSCALEHLGSLGHGKKFIYESIKCLKPGGVAVHTTEFNVSSNSKTVDFTETVLFRKKDIEEIVRQLRKDGYEIEVSFNQGKGPADNHVDIPPYKQTTHLKLLIGKYKVTSIGLIIKKP